MFVQPLHYSHVAAIWTTVTMEQEGQMIKLLARGWQPLQVTMATMKQLCRGIACLLVSLVSLETSTSASDMMGCSNEITAMSHGIKFGTGIWAHITRWGPC